MTVRDLLEKMDGDIRVDINGGTSERLYRGMVCDFDEDDIGDREVVGITTNGLLGMVPLENLNYLLLISVKPDTL